jgi:TatD DNase family protein
VVDIIRRVEAIAPVPDTHAHLDDQAFDDDLDSVLGRAAQEGVGPILAVGSDGASSLKAVTLARRYRTVYAAVGVHPHEASRFAEERDVVRALLHEEKVVAVGEIGLDYVRSRAALGEQMEAFREQLGWARECGLPVSVHNREADDDILREVGIAGCTAVLHCFSSTWETAMKGLELGCAFSFAGNITFPKSAILREVAGRIPLDRLLVESDAPVLAPQPKRGRRNEPAFVTMTAVVVAHERRMDERELRAAVAANAERLFGWTAS